MTDPYPTDAPCRALLLAIWLLVGVGPAAGFAEEAIAPTPPAPAPAPAPYSLPWQLRPTTPSTSVRSDSSFVVRTPSGGAQEVTLVTMLGASYRISKGLPLAPLIRLGVVRHDTSTRSGAALINPVLGASYLLALVPGLKINLFLAFTLPIGMGGGNAPDAAASAAAKAGVLARSGMDSAMFAVNDFAVLPGVGVSYSVRGFTAQVEATLAQLIRVRGEAVAPDPSRTNFMSGVHLGYFPREWLSLGAELRYQRWLSTPKAVTSEALRDNLTFAIGPRLHVQGPGFWVRPGFSITFPLDSPMSNQGMTIVQVDVPVAF